MHLTKAEPASPRQTAEADLSKLFCDETINSALFAPVETYPPYPDEIFSRSLNDDSSEKGAEPQAEAPEPDSEGEASQRVKAEPEEEKKAEPKKVKRLKRRKKREYRTYTNKRKIEFFELAEHVGNKRAAQKLKISWSTVKSWIKKDAILRQDQRSYVEILRRTVEAMMTHR